MFEQSGTRALVYEVLDQVLADRTVAAPSRGAIFSAVDQLRQTCAPEPELRRAERISIEMHKLQWARLRGDHAASEAALQELKRLAASWLDCRIRG
jgi:hypothetical protein